MTDEKRSAAGRPKSTEKQQQILQAASDLFLKQGLLATSMDNVAKEAGVSKQTVYSHFKNKDALFVAVIDTKCHQYQMDEAHILNCPKDLEGVLAVFGELFVKLLHDEEVISMHRAVVGEVSSNTHVAQLFFDAGPKQGKHVLKTYLRRQTELPIPEEKLQYLAMLFFNMLKGDHFMKNLMGLPARLSEAEQKQLVQQVTRDFMAILRQHADLKGPASDPQPATH